MPVQRVESTTPLVPNLQGYSGDGFAAGDNRHDVNMGAFGGARPKSRTPTVEQVSGKAVEEILLAEKEHDLNRRRTEPFPLGMPQHGNSGQAKTFPTAMDHSKLTLSVQKVDTSVQTSPEPEDTGNFNFRPSVPSVNQGTTSSAEDKPPATEYESRFENDFNVHDVIGKGGFGCVFSVTHKLDKHPYAVKRMKIKESDLELALREVQILACLQHENVVRYHTTWTENPPDEWQKSWDRNHGCTEDSSSENEESSSTHNENQSQSNNNANGNNNNATGNNNNLPVTVAKATFSNAARPSLTDGMFNNQIDFRFGGTEILNSASAEDFSGSWTSSEGNDSISGSTDNSKSDGSQSSMEKITSSQGNFAAANTRGDDNNCDESDNIVFDEEATLPGKENQARTGTRTSSQSSDDSVVIEFAPVPVNGAQPGNNTNASSDTSNSQSYKGDGESSTSDSQSYQGDGESSINNSQSYQSNGENNKRKVTAGQASAEASQSHVNSGRHNRPIYDRQNNVNNNCPDTLVCSKPRTPTVYLYIKMELCGEGTLKNWLKNKDREKRQIMMFLHGITAGLKYIHGAEIIHRDLKPDNIFFTSAPNSKELIPKIGDFGLSKSVCQGDCEDNLRHMSQVGTDLYRSPELNAGKKYCYKTDVFSLGVMLAEMLMPFGTKCERSLVLMGMLTDFPKDLENNHQRESELIKRMISENVDERPSAEDLHGHEIFWDLQ